MTPTPHPYNPECACCPNADGTQPGVAHTHREYVPGCYRCDLSREETTHLLDDVIAEFGVDLTEEG